MRRARALLVFSCALAAASGNPLRADGSQALSEPEIVSDGVRFSCSQGWLSLEVCSDSIIRVSSSPDPAFFSRPSLVVETRELPHGAWSVEKTGPRIVKLRTPKLVVAVDRTTGAVSFADALGRPLLSEKAGSRGLEPAEVQGVRTFHVGQRWLESRGEALYGLGENQLGLLNLKGYDLDLWQHNGTVALPFLVSSRGYGVLWDNASYTRFGNRDEFRSMADARLFDVHGKAGGLTASYFAGTDFAKLVDTQVQSRLDVAIPDGVKDPNLRVNPLLPAEGGSSVRWEGSFEAGEAGPYTFESFSNGTVRLWIDDRLVMDHWRQGWLPWLEIARVTLAAGTRHKLDLEWARDGQMPTLRLRWKPPARDPSTALWSEVGDGTDYYLVYGPSVDSVVGGYRQLTGRAPMMPAWAFGLWQSRERYETAQASLDVVREFRRRSIPFDAIVQDWRYWPEGTWGSHQFDPARFPDPDGWIRDIHALHAHLMISVWGKFVPGTPNFDAMRDGGFLYGRNLAEGTKDWLGEPYTFYDAFNPAARALFWDQIDRQLFRRGIDAWWMDATEPDIRPTPTLDGQRDYVNPTALGPGSRVLNAYPLLNSEGVYEGQRRAAPDQRVFILTRSAFAGQQRYAAATWSGDSSSTWTAMRKQITAGLGLSLSGIPYWTMDSGGFSVPDRFATNPRPQDVEEWRELNARWFEFAAFVPILRVHGQAPFREMWEMGGETGPAYKAQLKADRARYRLLPYIYSLAGAVNREDSTFMRALVMDYADDPAALDISDEYMFGPALLVSPVTTFGARRRPVYLPGKGLWYDFYSGKAFQPGQVLEAPAPYDALPVFARAGSIIPVGPEVDYVGEKPWDPVTLYVYAGADGAFTLYEDDGVSYGYERGAFSTVAVTWNDASRTLRLAGRQGSYRAGPQTRTFNLVEVSPSHPVGFSPDARESGTPVTYAGDPVDVVLP